MNGSFLLLCVLILILIGVISSDRIRQSVGKISEWVVYQGFKTVFVIVGLILLVSAGWVMLNWSWGKLSQVFPEMWPLGEVVPFVVMLILIGFAISLIESIDKKLKNKYGEKRTQRVYAAIGNAFMHMFLALGVALICLLVAMSVAINNDLMTPIFFYLFGTYLVIRYFVIPVAKRYIKKT